jgi:hypothetical protein
MCVLRFSKAKVLATTLLVASMGRILGDRAQDGGNEMLPRPAPAVGLDNYDLGSKLGFSMVGMLL